MSRFQVLTSSPTVQGDTAPSSTFSEREFARRADRLAQKKLPDPVKTLLLEGFHRLAGLLLLALTFPLFPLIALLIKFDDGGGVFYRGERLGRNKKRFTIHKFRTLKERAEEHLDGRLLPLANGYETRVGRFLRESRLDELPQLFNVLLGDMHLVGPRPVRASVYRHLCRQISGYDRLFTVKPGLTGFAQFYTPYHTDKRIRLRLDMIYLNRKSLAVDAGLLFSTIVSACRRSVRMARTMFVPGALSEWRTEGGVERNRRRMDRRPIDGVAEISFVQGENGSSREIRKKATILDLNEKAAALLSRKPIPEDVGEVQLRFLVTVRRGRERRVKTARCRGRIIRRMVLPPPAHEPARRDQLSVIRITPLSRLESYKIEKYFLRKSVADL